MGGEVKVLVTLLCLSAVLTGSEGRRRSREEEEEEALKRKQLQEEHLSKVSQMIYSHFIRSLVLLQVGSEMLFSVVIFFPVQFSVPTTMLCSKLLKTLCPLINA